MKKVQDYDLVRRMFYCHELSRREISRRTGFHRITINKMLEHSVPPNYRLPEPRVQKKLMPFTGIIDTILKADKKLPKKQRHTALRIFERLRDEHGFTGKYTIVKDYVRDKKITLKEVFFPLEQAAGTSQVDFGEAMVVINGCEEKAHFFCMALPFSDVVYVQAYPTQAFEAVASGHIAAYKFFGGVPHTNLYDNMSTVVKTVLKNSDRELTEDFVSLRSHYLFESRFCNVARPNEKGVVETLVGYVRRNFFVPIPHFSDWEALNAYLEEQCIKRLSVKAAGKEKSVWELFEEECSTFLPLPSVEFEACCQEGRCVSSLSLVRFKNNSYSVPVEYAYRQVTVRAYVFNTKICHKDTVIAVHKRSYGRGDFIFDPRHYLPLLKRKPGGLDGALPFSSWKLPECFETLRRYLEAKDKNGGKREYIQVLQLLKDHTVEEVRYAIEKAFNFSCVNFTSIKMMVILGREPSFQAVRLSQERLNALPKVHVARQDIGCYGALLQGGVR